MALLQAHHYPPRNQQITAGVSYNLVNAKFICSLCTVELPETKFREHLEGHLTLKPYLCKYCYGEFKTRGDVCVHLRSYHQQDKQLFMLKIYNRTKEIIQTARHIGTVFYKPVNVLVQMSNSAAVVISKTPAQNLTTPAGQKQKKIKAPLANWSHLSSLGPTSTVRSTLHTAISPELNSNTVITSAIPQLPAEQRRLTTQSQTGSVPTTSTNVLQTQAPSCLSQNVCTPASDISLRLPFPQKLSRQVPETQMASTLLSNLVNNVSASSVIAPNTHNSQNQLVPEKLYDSVTDTPLLAMETAAVSSITHVKRPSSKKIENSRYSFTINPLSAVDTAVTNSITQTEGLLAESIRKSHDNATFMPSLANEAVVVNPRTRTEKLSTGRIGVRGDYISLGCFYGCGICVISFPTAVELEVHVQRVHTLEQNLPCIHCGFRCRSSKHLIQHMEDHFASDNRKTFSCSLLENSDKVAQFENNDMKFIIRTLKTVLAAKRDVAYHFVCDMCQSEFAILDQLELHLQESLLKVIECKYCTSFFLNTISWQKHMAIEHVGLPRMYCIRRKMFCFERKMHSNVSHQASQEDIPSLLNTERDAETTVFYSDEYSSGSKDLYITSITSSLPLTRASDFASTSVANFNSDMAETRTILCLSEQNKLKYTENTCLPVEDVEANIDNRQESRHSSVVLENNIRSGVQHDIEHIISNVVKDGGDQAASAAVNGKSISQTVFLSSHASTVGGNSIQEHQQTDVLPSYNIHQAGEVSRTNCIVSVQSITDESILSLQLENIQKPTERSVVQQTVKDACVVNQNFESAHNSERKINDLLKEPCTNKRSHCTPNMSSVLKTVSHDSGDIVNPATNSLGSDHDSCLDIDFISSKDPACTLQESVGDFAGNDDILENDISYGHDLLHLNIDKTSSNLTQYTQAEKQETKTDGLYNEIHYNKNSLVSTQDGRLYASNETSACIESRETSEENVLNSPSQSDNFMEESNNTASVDQTSIASNITENKDSHIESSGLSDKVSTQHDLSDSLFRYNCSTLISCSTEGDHNVQPKDKSLKISLTSKCAKCRLVTEESLHPDNSTEHVISKTVDAAPSNDSKSLSKKKKIETIIRDLKRKISENSGKIGYHITRSKVDPPESSTIKPDGLSGHSKTCVGPEISTTNPALKSDLETAADNGSIVLSESKNTARDFTISNREMLNAHSKRKSEAGQGEGVITSKLLRINSEKHNKPEDTINKLDRAVTVSQSAKDIQGAEVPVQDSARFRCSACPFVTSQSYTELKQHVKSRHPQDTFARVCIILSRNLQNASEQSERWQVNSESSNKIHTDIGMYKCIRTKCTFTCKWNPEKMKAHIKSKHPYYSCGYCKAPYTTLACLYKHLNFLHRSKKPSVMEDTIALDLLFKCVDIPYNGQGEECTDVTLQTLAKRKNRSQPSKTSKAKASSQLKVLKMKRHAPVKSCDVNVTSNKQNQPLGDSTTERTSEDNDDSQSKAAQRLKTSQCKVTHSKSESILEQISREISPVPEHELSSAEEPTVTSKTAAISNNGDSLSAMTERNLFKTIMSSTFAQTFDHTHRIPPTASLHTKKTVAPNATLLLSPPSAENNTRRNKVKENKESGRYSSAQNACSKMRPLGPVSSPDTVRQDNSSAATSNHIDINVSLNSATSVQSLGTVKQQELNSVDISDKQESSNRLGNVHETLPEICSETASCVSDTVLHHTAVASAIVIPNMQIKKHCGTWVASQLEAKTAAKGNENKNFVPEDLRTHPDNNLGMQKESKIESKFVNVPTTDIMSLNQHNYPLKCTACSRVLKCVRDIEKHYNTDHPREDVQLTERKSGFVYSNSGKCVHWKEEFKAPTDSYLCRYCEFRSTKRSDVERHLRRVHPTCEVRVFTLCKPNTDRHSTRSKVTALPNEASSSSSPSSYFCNVCSDVKNSEFQFRLHLASHSCYKHTTQLTAGASFLCHTCGYIAKSSSDFVQHTEEHLSERRFKCLMCEHDSHNKKSMKAHIKSVHNKTVDDDVGIIDRDKERNIDLKPRLVNIDPEVVLIDPFSQPTYLQQLLRTHGIKTQDLTGCRYPDILTSEQDVNGKYVAIK